MNSYIAIAQTMINVIIRYANRNKNDYISDSAIEIGDLISNLGLNEIDKMCVEGGVKRTIANTARRIEESKILDNFSEDVRNRILKTAFDDFNMWISRNACSTEYIMKQLDVLEDIKCNSEIERRLWSEKECGAYDNCIRYMALIFREYQIALPSFKVDALVGLFSRIDEFENDLLNRLDNQTAIIEKSLSVEEKHKNYEIDYLSCIANTYGTIELFGSGIQDRKIRKYDVMASFVQLSCIKQDDEYDSVPVSIESALKDNVIWLSGDAGGGKTTLLQWLAVTAAIKRRRTAELGELVPVIIKLRNADFPLNLNNELSKVTTIIGKVCPDDYVNGLMKYDKLLLLLDGVDEVSEKNQHTIMEFIDRLEACLLAITNEKKNRIRSRIIITARPYVEDMLTCKHRKYVISKMKMPQIGSFIYNWHKAIFTNEIDENKIVTMAEKLKNKIFDSAGLRNIASTPLLCAMICAINYHNNGVIPTNKCELYDQCCKMLIEGRDKERAIDIDELHKYDYLDYTAKYSILQDIALYMLRSGITEERKDEIILFLETEYKNKSIIKDERDRQNPEELLDFLIKRTGIIRELSKGYVDFVHKTFMEFLAAEAIKHHYVWREIKTRVDDGFWKETIIMVFWRLDANKAKEMLKDFIAEYRKTNNEEIILMASMCSTAATNVDIKVQQTIEQYVTQLIPPDEKNIASLGLAGEYVLPFLKDKLSYDDQQRCRCLSTVRVLMEEFDYCENVDCLNVLLSYLEGNGNYTVKGLALTEIANISADILKESDVSTTLYNAFLNNKNDCIELSSLAFGFIEPRDERIKVKKLIIYMNLLYDYALSDYYSITYISTADELFYETEEVHVVDVSFADDLQLIEYLSGVNKLHIRATACGDEIIQYISGMEMAKRLKYLYFEADSLKYISDRDIEKFNNIEELELVILNASLDYNLFEFDLLPNLKRVKITVNSLIYYDNENYFKEMISLYKAIKFNIYKI